MCCIEETDLNIKARHYLPVKNWKMRLQDNGPKKQAGVAILNSNKIDFKPKFIRRDGKDITRGYCSPNVYVPNTRAPKFTKEALLQF